MTPETVISCDPGSEQSALLVWDGKAIEYAEILPNENALEMVAFWTVRYGAATNTTFAIEMFQSFGMIVGKSVFETCLYVGRLYQLWKMQTGATPRLVFRKDVKLHHCGNVRAKDSNIRAALIDKWGSPGVKSNPGLTYKLKADLWSAFAIATFVKETQEAVKV